MGGLGWWVCVGRYDGRVFSVVWVFVEILDLCYIVEEIMVLFVCKGLLKSDMIVFFGNFM